MKSFLCLLTSFASLSLFGQTTVIEYEVNNLQKTNRIEEVFNDSVSVSKIVSADEAASSGISFFVKDKLTNAIYFSDNFMNVVFHVKDSLFLMDWNLTDDTSTILNRRCLSAKTNFRGRNYRAYYAPSLPAPDGPWKFGGLPGLILAVAAEDGFIEWKAVKIVEHSSKKVAVPDIQRYTFLSWNEFVERYVATVGKYIKRSRSNGTLANETSALIKLDAVEIFYPELQTGNGLKF